MTVTRNFIKQKEQKSRHSPSIPKILDNGSDMINSTQISQNGAHMHTALMDHFRITFVYYNHEIITNIHIQKSKVQLLDLGSPILIHCSRQHFLSIKLDKSPCTLLYQQSTFYTTLKPATFCNLSMIQCKRSNEYYKIYACSPSLPTEKGKTFFHVNMYQIQII